MSVIVASPGGRQSFVPLDGVASLTDLEAPRTEGAVQKTLAKYVVFVGLT